MIIISLVSGALNGYDIYLETSLVDNPKKVAHSVGVDIGGIVMDAAAIGLSLVFLVHTFVRVNKN